VAFVTKKSKEGECEEEQGVQAVSGEEATGVGQADRGDRSGEGEASGDGGG